MENSRTRKIVIVGVLGAIIALMSFTPLGFVPWFSGVSLAIVHIPVIIAAIIEGPLAALVTGLIFGLSSLYQAHYLPRGPADPLFQDPFISVLPRLLFSLVPWLIWKLSSRRPVIGLILTGALGSLAHTILVLAMLGLRGYLPWGGLSAIAVANGLPEAGLAAVLTLAIVAAWWQMPVGKRHGADL